MLGDALLGAESETVIAAVWPIISAWVTPDELLAHEAELREIGSWLGAETTGSDLLELARAVVAGSGTLDDDNLESLVSSGLLRRSASELAMIADPQGEEPVIANTAALRVAGRFFQGSERWLKNRNSDGRIAVGRLIGFEEESRSAQIGLIELGARVCTPKAPDCGACPLSGWCRYASRS